MSTKTSATETLAVTFHERRPIVAKLYVRHQKAPAIHQALAEQGIECDIRQVYRDIDLLEAMWQKELVTDPVAYRAQELAEYQEVATECWLNYSTSRDVKWLAELRGWKKRISELLGLDAPARHDVAFVTTLADVTARLAEGAPMGENQVDMAALRHLEALSPPSNGASGNGAGGPDD